MGHPPPHLPTSWCLVRRVRSGPKWHAATDHLNGTDEYGSPCGRTSSCSFSIRFDNLPFTYFKFETGDGEKWLIATKDAVIGGYYTNATRPIVSASNGAKQALWYRRSEKPEDPWISITDHFTAVSQGDILYGGASFGREHASAVLLSHNGANVYIDSDSCPTRPRPPAVAFLDERFSVVIFVGAGVRTLYVSRRCMNT